MPTAQAASSPIPPEIVAYMRDPVEESRQFEFLIGEWDVDGRRHGPAGEQPYVGTWRAHYLHGGRMVVDDFTVHAPSGQELSAFVTLRTFSPATRRWEMAGMAALQPAVNGKWFGNFVDGEMHLEAEGTGPSGQLVKNRIRFYEIEQSRFKWVSHVSVDGGNAWMEVSSLVATRVRQDAANKSLAPTT